MEEVPVYQNQHITIPTLPDLVIEEAELLEPNWKKAQSIVSFALSMLIYIPAFLILFFGVQTQDVRIWLAVFTPLILLTFWLTYYPYLAYPKKGYLLRTHDITYKTGLIWQKEITITYNRIQHLEVSQGPVEKWFHLASLQLFTAGGQKSDMEISGLNPEKANKIKDWVAKKAEVDL